MNENERQRVELVEKMMKIIGAKWKPAIIYCLVHEGKMHFGDLRRAIPQVTQRILTLRLRELERDGLITRTVLSNIPPSVTYEMTSLGMEVHPFFRDLCLWAEQRLPELETALQATKSGRRK